MNIIRKRVISFVTACAIAVTLVPFTGNTAEAATSHAVGKVTLKLAEGALLQPGYDEDIPGTLDVSFDTSDSTADLTALNSGKLTIDRTGWIMKDGNEWDSETIVMGPADVGEYRMAIDLRNNVNSETDEVLYYYNTHDSTTAYVDGEKWDIIYRLGPYGQDMIRIAGPICKVDENTKPVYKTSIPQPTNTPTAQPTEAPTKTPTVQPTTTQAPTLMPTQTPTTEPTKAPTVEPTKAPAQPTQAPADPTTQPAAQGGVSDKIKGAPKNLVCGISKGDARQIDVEFTPDLECGIDQSCGVVIAASTDNQATWQEVSSWSFTGGNKDLKWNTKALNGSSYFKMELEKTYYVKAYYVESDGKKGPDSNICGPFGPVADESKIPGKVETASASAVKITGDNAGSIKKDSAFIAERDFYKLTVSVKEMKGNDVSFDVKLEGKAPYDTYLIMQSDDVRYLDKNGKSHGTIFNTVDMSDIAVGCTKITVPVTCTLRNTYDRNQKTYKFEESFYFEVAPQSPSLSASKADKKSITLGKAYSNKINCTDSGTTVYYRKQGTKAWKSKTFTKGKVMKFTGLSAGTTYQFKAVDFVKSKDKNGKVKNLKSKESKIKLFRTAYKTCPAIKSAKTSKVSQKTKKFNGQLVKSGINWKWQRAYSLKVTSFKLTIKFNSKPAAEAIMIKDPDGVVHVIDGTKDTYTLSTEIKEYKKGKRVKFMVATVGNGSKSGNRTAVSPYKAVYVTLK